MKAELRTAVVGSGFLGGMIANHLRKSGQVVGISARSLLAGTTCGLTFEAAPRLVFAHGMNVNVRTFAADYETLLKSRLQPLQEMADRLAGVRPAGAVLISSTAAYGGLRDRGLGELQIAFESRFEDIFGGADSRILRVGTVISPGSQVYEGLSGLRKTYFLKRLRLRHATSIPWTDGEQVCEAVDDALAGGGGRITAVAYRDGLDLNVLLDAIVGGRLTVGIPTFAYSWILQQFGVRPEFFDLKLADIDPAELYHGAPTS